MPLTTESYFPYAVSS